MVEVLRTIFFFTARRRTVGARSVRRRSGGQRSRDTLGEARLYNHGGGGNSSTGRAPDCGSDGCGFDSRFPPQNFPRGDAPPDRGWIRRVAYLAADLLSELADLFIIPISGIESTPHARIR